MITEESHQYSDELLKKFWEIENSYLEDPTLTVNERKVVEHVVFVKKGYGLND